jgi:hypothetical protein
MRRHGTTFVRTLRVVTLVLLLTLCGCRAQVARTEEGAIPEDTTTRLNNKIAISLADWLRLPRAELAKLSEEWHQTVAQQREAARSNGQSVQLLPQLRPPMVTAGFAEAKFSPSVGFSLPLYLREGQKDAAVALHLARLGDQEAARKLADPADKELLAQIDACRSARNYPIEWTRLVSLVLQSAELKLASGDPDGAAELVLLHRQLRSLLVSTSETPVPAALGAALLPRGRQALMLAAAAWREPHWNKTALAADIDAALADWGEAPDPILSFPRSMFPCEGNWIAQTPLAVQRALDLLALPLPSEGADGIVAFRDEKQALKEVCVIYRPKLNERFPEPRQLALLLLDHGYKSEEKPLTSPGLIRQSWTGGGLSYEVILLTRGNIGGAVIHIRQTGHANTPGEQAPGPLTCPVHLGCNARDFGAVHLDRSFEQNRLNLAPDQTGRLLEIKDAAKLAAITLPPPFSSPGMGEEKRETLAAAVLQREANADLLARLTLRWSAEQNRNALNQLALPLWAAYGPARLESVEEAGGGSFVLTWQNETTRLRLHLPFEDKAPELQVEDSRGLAALPIRMKVAADLDRRERQARLAAGKPRQRLQRFLQLPSHGIDELRLGQRRKEVLAILRRAHSLRVQPLSDGLNILVLDEPSMQKTGATPLSPAPPTGETLAPLYWPRQLFVRFGADDHVAEVRVRYQEWPRMPGSKTPRLLDKLRSMAKDAAESLPPTWAGLWADLPPHDAPIRGGKGGAVLYRWQDDVTCLTYQRDSGGSEVVLRDRLSHPPVPYGNEGELPPLRFCRDGVEGCVLGDNQAEVHKRWQVRNPLLAANGAEILVMPANSPYDVLLVWYNKGKVSRLIARHRQPKTLETKQVSAALQQAWGADFDHLGFLRRHDGAQGFVLQSYGFHDDCTRVRLFAQKTEEGIRLFTEWRSWPIAAQTLASK